VLRRLTAGLAAAFLLAVAAAVLIRAAPVPAALLDADPLQARTPLARPGYLVLPAGTAETAGGDAVSPVWPLPPAELLDRLTAIALAEPRTVLAGGDPARGRVTLVQRSRLMGYPDVIAVRALPAPGGATLAILSQSRFGGNDWGVNRARVERWLAALTAAAAPVTAPGAAAPGSAARAGEGTP